jgi:hypothetical protein
MTCFYGDRGPYFTYVFVVHSKKVASSIDMTNHNKDYEAARDFFSAAAPSPLATLSGSELSPSFGWERGFPDAKAVCLATSKASGSSRGTSVYYFTECVATDTKVYFICGTRSTRSAAKKVLDSFALKDVVYKNKKAGFKAAFSTIPIVYNGSEKDKTDSFWNFYCTGAGPENTGMTVYGDSKDLVNSFEAQLNAKQQRKELKDHATMGLGYKVKAKGIKYSEYKGHL